MGLSGGYGCFRVRNRSAEAVTSFHASVIILGMERGTHVTYFDVLRVLAICFVVFNHTWADGFLLYARQTNPVGYVVFLIVAMLCKTAVPLFFMISGALLLGKNESPRQVWKRRVLPMTAVLMVMSTLQYVLLKLGVYPNYGEYFAHTPAGLDDFIRMIFSSGAILPYWFLYAYISFLILLPFLQRLAQHLPTQYFWYLLALQLGFWMLSASLSLWWQIDLNSNVMLPLASVLIIFYPLMGYWLATFSTASSSSSSINLDSSKAVNTADGVESKIPFLQCRRITTKFVLLLMLATVVTLSYSCILVVQDVRDSGNPISQTYISTLISLPTLAVFVIVRLLVEKAAFGSKAVRIWKLLGSLVFGTYLLEMILRRYVLIPIFSASEPCLGTLSATLICVFAVVISGMAITWLLKRIPKVNHFI